MIAQASRRKQQQSDPELDMWERLDRAYMSRHWRDCPCHFYPEGGAFRHTSPYQNRIDQIHHRRDEQARRAVYGPIAHLSIA